MYLNTCKSKIYGTNKKKSNNLELSNMVEDQRSLKKFNSFKSRFVLVLKFWFKQNIYNIVVIVCLLISILIIVILSVLMKDVRILCIFLTLHTCKSNVNWHLKDVNTHLPHVNSYGVVYSTTIKYIYTLYVSITPLGRRRFEERNTC